MEGTAWELKEKGTERAHLAAFQNMIHLLGLLACAG
jgi:hypothetical protein